MGKNLTEKLIKNHLLSGKMEPGEEICIKMDQTLTHDITAVMSYLAFERFELDRVKTELSVSYLDHNLLYIDSKTPDDHVFLQSIAKKYGIYLSRPGNGICHPVHYARYGKPGKTLIGTDSHTTTAGAIGMLAIGGGGMDVAGAMAGLPIRLLMPHIVKVNLKGKLRPGVASKDIILEMLRIYGVRGGLGKVFEYVGDGTKTLSVSERATITNMGAETGATASIFAADETVKDFFVAQNRLDDFVEITPDANCQYNSEVTIDLEGLESLVACPHMPDNIRKVKEIRNLKVQQVYVGSCTNGSYSDIKKVAAILKGRTVHEDVSFTVSISTRQIFEQLVKDGVVADLLSSGARITEVACGACAGIGQAPPTNGVSVRTSNRNFKGRGGTPDANIYLVSPEVAAATAIMGFLSEPIEVIEDLNVLRNVNEPGVYHINDNLMIHPFPLEEAKQVDIIRGPNIKELPINKALQKSIYAKVSLKVGDNISTDDITPANAQFSSMRSNIPLIAEYAFSRYDPNFVSRAKEFKYSIIIGGENYGQGSSREHAAIVPMFLGVKAIICKSIARIHKKNLINHGIVPLIFENPLDYDRILIATELRLENLYEQIKSNQVIVKNCILDEEYVTLLNLTDTEKEILRNGGFIPHITSRF